MSRLPPEIKASVLALGILLGAGINPGTGGPDEAPEETARERTLRVSTLAFERFKDGLATGKWDGFLDMLSDDFTFFFPTGKWHGEHQGRDKARGFVSYVSQVFPEGLSVTLDRVTANDTTAVFEFHDEGRLVLSGETRDYKNRVAISLEVRGEKISAYREYFGSDGRSY